MRTQIQSGRGFKILIVGLCVFWLVSIVALVSTVALRDDTERGLEIVRNHTPRSQTMMDGLAIELSSLNKQIEVIRVLAFWTFPVVLIGLLVVRCKRNNEIARKDAAKKIGAKDP